MVDMKVVLKASSENRNRIHVLPTPESPISNNLKSRSYDFLAMIAYSDSWKQIDDTREDTLIDTATTLDYR